MNRHTVIVIVSCAVIASTIGYSVFNLMNATNLEFVWAGQEKFNLFSLMYGAKLKVCNPTDLPITFNSYEISSVYKDDKLGTFHLGGGQIQPKSFLVLRGDFDSGDKQVAEIMSLFLDTEVQGSDVTKVDAKKLSIMTDLKTNFLGIIPYTISKSYGGSEFFDLMNGKGSSFEC